MIIFKRKRESGSEEARSGQSCIDKEASLGQSNGVRENAYRLGWGNFHTSISDVFYYFWSKYI